MTTDILILVFYAVAFFISILVLIWVYKIYKGVQQMAVGKTVNYYIQEYKKYDFFGDKYAAIESLKAACWEDYKIHYRMVSLNKFEKKRLPMYQDAFKSLGVEIDLTKMMQIKMYED